MKTLSFFCLPFGDCPDGSDWRRHLLLVHGWIWRLGRPQKVSVLPNRHPNHGCVHLAYCPSVLLLPYLDVEQAPMVALHCRRRRKSNAFLFQNFYLVTFYNSFLLLRQPGRCGAASRQVSYNPCCELVSDASFSRRRSESSQSLSQVYMYAPSVYTACHVLHLTNIALVDYECSGGHIDCSYDDLPRT